MALIEHRGRTSENTAREPWRLSVEGTAKALGSDSERGLSAGEAARRLDTVGRNVLVEQAQPGPWRIFARQLAHTLTAVLVVGGAVPLGGGAVTDTGVIGVFVVFHAGGGFG